LCQKEKVRGPEHGRIEGEANWKNETLQDVDRDAAGPGRNPKVYASGHFLPRPIRRTEHDLLWDATMFVREPEALIKKAFEMENSANQPSSDRRSFLQTTVAVAATGLLATKLPQCLAQAPEGGEFKLPPLPYDYAALEPVIDKETMTIHHTKHHQAYITKLNAAIKDNPSLAGKSIVELLQDLNAIPETVRKAVRDNGGGHANHTFFWSIMQAPNSKSAPSAKLSAAIDAKFGSLDKLKEKFNAAAVGQFGSGWAWLVEGSEGLEVMSTPNQDSPISVGKKPLLGIDVWEHAYYLKYQNKRADYVAAWWQLVNWDKVGA
jgi:superoxide dismutase, Fe-Mn family